jgi:hypothetical protein
MNEFLNLEEKDPENVLHAMPEHGKQKPSFLFQYLYCFSFVVDVSNSVVRLKRVPN